MCVNPVCGRTKEFFADNQVVLDALKEKEEAKAARQG